VAEVNNLPPLKPRKWDRVTISGASQFMPNAHCEIIDEPVQTNSGLVYRVALVKSPRVRFKVAFEYLCLTAYRKQAPSLASLDGYDACVQNGRDPQGIMPVLL
jgi:hypothetical protein